MSGSMCGCGCSIISSLMKRLGRSACCSDLLSCSQTSEQLQRLATGRPPPPKNAKPFPSSDSLAKVQEVASWLLEMNQDLLSGGSSSRRSRGLGGQAVRGNASSTTRAPQQAAEDDEDEHVNRVVEEEELRQRPEASQADGEREQPWAPGESGASNGPQGEGEEGRGGPLSEVTGDGKGSQWQWGTDQQRQLQGQRPLEEDEDEEEEEENNNSSIHQEEEDTEGRTEGGEEHGREEGEEEEEEEEEDDEEMDQDSDEFEHSAESGREEEEEEGGEGEEGLRSPSLRNSVSAPSRNQETGCPHQSSSSKKVSCCCCRFCPAALQARAHPPVESAGTSQSLSWRHTLLTCRNAQVSATCCCLPSCQLGQSLK